MQQQRRCIGSAPGTDSLTGSRPWFFSTTAGIEALTGGPLDRCRNWRGGGGGGGVEAAEGEGGGGGQRSAPRRFLRTTIANRDVAFQGDEPIVLESEPVRTVGQSSVRSSSCVGRHAAGLRPRDTHADTLYRIATEITGNDDLSGRGNRSRPRGTRSRRCLRADGTGQIHGGDECGDVTRHMAMVQKSGLTCNLKATKQSRWEAGHLLDIADASDARDANTAFSIGRRLAVFSTVTRLLSWIASQKCRAPV